MQDTCSVGRKASGTAFVALIEEQPYGEWVGSDQTASELLGVHRATIIRWKQKLEREGRIRRCGWKHWGGKKTVRWRVCRRRATQRPSGRTTNFKTTTPFGCGTPRRPARGRRRRLMENHPAPRLAIVRASGEETAFNAGDAIAATVDVIGFVAPQFKARIGKHAKELLEAGCPADTVVAACVMGVRMGRPHLVQTFAQDIQNAKAGLSVTDWSEYRNAIRRLSAGNKPKTAIDAAFDTMREERERKGKGKR